MVSIIIAAHNEGSTLGRTLDALLAGTRIQVQIIVVANGCSDNTAATARRRNGVQVIELEESGKAAALNAGDEAAEHFPRIYLDADILVPPGGVEALVSALRSPGILVAVPDREVVTVGSPWFVRAYSRVHAQLPALREGLFGRGMIVMSRAARSRFGVFPIMVADDLFLDSLFSRDERVCVKAVRVPVHAPVSTRELLNRLVRVRRGSAAMRRAAREGTITDSIRPPDRWSWLRDVVAKDYRLLPSGLAYAAITLTAAARARRGSLSNLDWGRDRAAGVKRTKFSQTPRIGFLGVQCDTANLGLAALAYSVSQLVADAFPGPAEFVFFSVNSPKELRRMRDLLGLSDKIIRAVPFRHKRPASMFRSVREIAGCTLVLDFTGGDSFSDIYGTQRLLRKLFHKQLVLWTGIPLVLAPQTFGPLHSKWLRPWMKRVVNRSRAVFTRDDRSVHFLEELGSAPPRLSTDVAVTLPHEPPQIRPSRNDKIRVGLNVSGLLWSGGYTRDNQFGLATDYRNYCKGLIASLLAEDFEVYIVPHVRMRTWERSVEDDLIAAQDLLEIHPACQLAPQFSSPIEAKTYIAGMDVFIGSRMHATIAALSSGVPTIPAAYSRKFAGFFENLGYPVTVDLTTLGTEEALSRTLHHTVHYEDLLDAVTHARERSRELISSFTGYLINHAAHW